ncbi:MAG: PAS domain S-box protein [Verrucomicrobiae bacterium]|nr:PAS domain S-box protein [Verrucomicrobiae bacterium]
MNPGQNEVVGRNLLERPMTLGGMAFFASAGLFLFFWYQAWDQWHERQRAIEEEGRYESRVEMQVISRQIRDRLQGGLEQTLRGLEVMAQRAGENPQYFREKFSHDVAVEMGRYPWIEAVAYVEEGSSKPRHVVPAGALENWEVQSASREATPNTGELGAPDKARQRLSLLQMTQPGVTGFDVFLPVEKGGKTVGTLAARIRFNGFFREWLGNLIRDYDVKVMQKGKEWYSQPWKLEGQGEPLRQFAVSLKDQIWDIQLGIRKMPQAPEPTRVWFLWGMLVMGVGGSVVVGVLTSRSIRGGMKRRRWEREQEVLKEQVRKAEEDLTRFLDSAGLILVTVDEEGMIVSTNAPFETIFGKDTLGRGLVEAMRMPAGSAIEVRKVLLGRQAVEELETQWESEDREVKTMLWNVHPGWQGQQLRYVFLGRDITQRRRNAEALKLSEERYQILFEKMTEGVLVTDHSGMITHCNRAAEEMLGFQKRQNVASLLSDGRFAILGEDGVPYTVQTFPALRALQDQISQEPVIIGFRTQAGEVSWISVSVAVLHVDNQFQGLVITFNDVTHLKGTERQLQSQRELLRQVFHNTESAVALVNPAGHVALANPQFARMCGYTDPALQRQPAFEEVVGRITGQAANPEDVELRIRQAQERLQNEHFDFAFNQTMWIEVYTARLAGGYRLWSFRDVTERHTLERQMRQAQKMESVGTLAGGLAHDFNNILTVLQGYLTLVIEQTPAGDKKLNALKKAEEASARASALTRKLLTFARGGFYRKSHVRLDDIILGARDLLGGSIPGNIELQMDIDGAGHKVFADPHALEQIAINLCLNAVDAMPTGGKIILKTEYLDSLPKALLHRLPSGAERTGAFLKWTISDNGTGIPPEILSKIFEPFFTTKRNKSGSGLGLAMVYGILQSHGGLIDVLSQTGRGTTFYIYLPVKVEETAADLSSPVSPSDDISCLAGKTILLVDDEVMVLDMVKDLLEEKGVKVMAARNSEEAMRLFEGAHAEIDLVLTDLVMPGASGMDLIEQLHRVKPGIKVVLSSGYSLKGRLKPSQQQQVTAVLVKPYQTQKLFKTVLLALRGDVELERAMKKLFEILPEEDLTRTEMPG